MTKAEGLSESMEDYLEAILSLVRANKVARVRDIAAALQVAMPSVTAALKTLAQRKLVNYQAYQFVTLTDRGNELAAQVARRHSDLSDFLVSVLGLSARDAQANACRMEHAMDEIVLRRLRQLADFINRCPLAGAAWIEQFKRSCRDEISSKTACRTCGQLSTKTRAKARPIAK